MDNLNLRVKKLLRVRDVVHLIGKKFFFIAQQQAKGELVGFVIGAATIEDEDGILLEVSNRTWGLPTILKLIVKDSLDSVVYLSNGEEIHGRITLQDY